MLHINHIFLIKSKFLYNGDHINGIQTDNSILLPFVSTLPTSKSIRVKLTVGLNMSGKI